MSNIIPYRAGLDYPKGEESDKIIDQNFALLAKQGDKIGLYLKGSAFASAAQTITSTSYVDATNLKVSVNLTGGLVIVYASVSASASISSARLQLLKNAEEIDTAASTSATDGSSMASLFWAGNCAAGQTVFNIKAKTDANFIKLNEFSKSKIYVFEYTKG